MPNERLVCECDLALRKITFYVRDGFGDGCDPRGGRLANPGDEQAMAIRIFTGMLDWIHNPGPDPVPVERVYEISWKEPK